MKSQLQLHSCNSELALGISLLNQQTVSVNLLSRETKYEYKLALVSAQISSADILKADVFPCFSSLDKDIIVAINFGFCGVKFKNLFVVPNM